MPERETNFCITQIDDLYKYPNGVKQYGDAPGPLGEPLRDNKGESRGLSD